MYYSLVLKRVDDNHWQVLWDNELVYSAKGEDAELLASTFIDGLERGLRQSKQALGGSSRVKIKGWMDYLEAFPTYESYR